MFVRVCAKYECINYVIMCLGSCSDRIFIHQRSPVDVDAACVDGAVEFLVLSCLYWFVVNTWSCCDCVNVTII